MDVLIGSNICSNGSLLASGLNIGYRNPSFRIYHAYLLQVIMFNIVMRQKIKRIMLTRTGTSIQFPYFSQRILEKS